MNQFAPDLIPTLFATDSRELIRARVVALRADAIVVSRVENELRDCDILETEGGPAIVEGDAVLVWFPPDPQERGVVLGRISSGVPQTTAPRDIVVEAKHSLTLRVGDGSITIREDGRILIKGKDLVSHAQGLNRIKGGSVSIN